MKKVVAVLFVLVFCLVASATAMAQGGPPADGQPAVTQARNVQVTQTPGVAVGVQTTVRPKIVVEPASVQFPAEMAVRPVAPMTVQTADGAPLRVVGATDIYAPNGIPVMIKEVPENPSWCARNLGWCALGIGVLAGASAMALDAAGAFDREVSFK